MTKTEKNIQASMRGIKRSLAKRLPKTDARVISKILRTAALEIDRGGKLGDVVARILLQTGPTERLAVVPEPVLSMLAPYLRKVMGVPMLISEANKYAVRHARHKA